VHVMCPVNVMIRAVDSPLKRCRFKIPAIPFSGSDLGQVIYSHSSVTKQCELLLIKRQWSLWLGG